MKIYSISLLAAGLLMGCSSATLHEDNVKKADEVIENESSVMVSDIMSSGSKEKLLRSVSIYFDTDSSSLLPKDLSLLNEVRKALSHDSDLKLYLHGHADEAGDKDYNIALSKRRAEAILDALKLEKETHKRTSLDFFGEDNPRCMIDEKNDMSCNRRVDIYLIK